MSSPYPTRQEEAYTAYWENNEDWLLEEFLERNPNLGPVKEWDNYDHAKFENYVQRAFESQGAD